MTWPAEEVEVSLIDPTLTDGRGTVALRPFAGAASGENPEFRLTGGLEVNGRAAIVAADDGTITRHEGCE